MAHPRNAFGAPPQGDSASGRAEPDRGVRLGTEDHAPSGLILPIDH